MPYEAKDADFKAISEGAKKSDAFRKLAGDPVEPDADDAGGDEDAALGEAFAAAKGNDEAGFKTAMAAAMRACYQSEASAK